MNTVRNHVQQPPKTPKEEVVKALREHMSEANADMLANRYEHADELAQNAVDWETIKRRILNSRPQPHS